MSAVDIYRDPVSHPDLVVSQHTIAKAVRVLAASNHVLSALMLIRGAYRTDDGAFASLDEAREIYRSIVGRDL